MEVDKIKWDDEVLSDICNDRDRELIKKIPLPREDNSIHGSGFLEN